jgi:hypothetical protein
MRLKRIGWMVREHHIPSPRLVSESFGRTRRLCMAAYSKFVQAQMGQPDRNYHTEKKLGYVDKMVPIYAEAPHD